MRQPGRISSVKAVALLGGATLLAFLIGPFYFVSGDDGTYIALAQSLREFDYRAINVPGDPIQTQYPPLFPMLLSPVAFPRATLGLIRAWVTLFSFLAVFSVAAAAMKRDPKTGLFATLPVLVSPLFGEYGTSILTEGVFLALSYAILARAWNWIKRDRATEFDWATPLLLITAILLRNVGVALFAAVVVSLMLTKRLRYAAWMTAIVVAGLIPWWFWQNTFQSDYIQSHILLRDIYRPGEGTFTIFNVVTERMPGHLARYAGRIMIDVLFPPFLRSIWPWQEGFALKMALSLVISGTTFFGFIRYIIRRGLTVEVIYIFATFGLLLIHPVFSDRYLFPILPSLVGFFLYAFSNPSLRRKVAVIWAVVLIAGCIWSIETPPPRNEIAYLQAVDWLAEHAGEDEIVLARKPATVWYHAGMKATGYPSTPDHSAWPQNFDWLIRDNYIIGIHAAQEYADPVIAENPRLQEAFRSSIDSSVRIYRLHKTRTYQEQPGQW